MVYRTPYPWYIKLLAYGILLDRPNSWYTEPPTHGMSNCLPIVFCMTPKPMVYRTPYPWYIKLPAYDILYDPHSLGISRHLPMVFCLTPIPTVYRTTCLWYFVWTLDLKVNRTPYPWYIELPAYGILFDPQTHGISNPLHMVYRTSCLWYFAWPPNQWYIEPPIHGI